MWDNHRILHILANGLFTLAILLAAYAISPLVTELPIFMLKEVSVSGVNSNDEEFKRIRHKQIDSIIRKEVTGSFFTVDLDEISVAFEKLPCVQQLFDDIGLRA